MNTITGRTLLRSSQLKAQPLAHCHTNQLEQTLVGNRLHSKQCKKANLCDEYIQKYVVQSLRVVAHHGSTAVEAFCVVNKAKRCGGHGRLVRWLRHALQVDNERVVHMCAILCVAHLGCWDGRLVVGLRTGHNASWHATPSHATVERRLQI